MRRQHKTDTINLGDIIARVVIRWIFTIIIAYIALLWAGSTIFFWIIGCMLWEARRMWWDGWVWNISSSIIGIIATMMILLWSVALFRKHRALINATVLSRAVSISNIVSFGRSKGLVFGLNTDGRALQFGEFIFKSLL